MRTLNLAEAANLLKMTPEGLRRKVIKGEIPAAKPGKCWCFNEDDLAVYLRSLYATPAETLQGVIEAERRKKWHSTKEVIHGGSTSVTVGEEYNKLLEPQIR